MEVSMAGFPEIMINEKVQMFWAALQRGEFITDAASEAGTYRKKGPRWMAATGGVRPRRGRDLQGRYLSFAEREEIALSSARGESMRCIARRLGRSPTTISRELRRNADRPRNMSAHAPGVPPRTALVSCRLHRRQARIPRHVVRLGQAMSDELVPVSRTRQQGSPSLVQPCLRSSSSGSSLEGHREQSGPAAPATA